MVYSLPTQPISQLPSELWALISDFLEYDELATLSTVNHLFFDLMMDKRHREINLLKYPSDPLWFWRNIEKIRSPDIARHVRILKVSPRVTWDAIHAQEHQFQTRNPVKKGILKPSLIRSLRKNLNLGYPPRKSILSATSVMSSLGLLSQEERELAIVSAITNLIGVTDLSIGWQGLQGHGTYHPCCPVLKIVLPTIGSTLRSLTLDIPSTILSQFNPSSVTFSGLQELNVKFFVDRASPYSPNGLGSTPNGPENTFQALVPFFNSLSATLTSMSIETSGHVALSPFFTALDDFPRLTHLSLTIPLDQGHLPNPAGLNRILLTSGSIENLSIRSSFCCRSYPVVSKSLESIWNWHEQCFRGVSSETLRVLCINIGYPFMVDDKSLRFIRPLLQNMESLTIDSHLVFSRAFSVLTILTGASLRSLCLNVDFLSPNLVNLLAGTCPNLNRLVLDIEGVRRFPGSDACTTTDFSTTFSAHRSRPSAAMVYDSWKLCDLEIWRFVALNDGSTRKTLQWDLMRVVARNIPSVKSFAGRGHTRVDECLYIL